MIDSPTKETYTSLIPIPSRYSSRFTWLIHLQRKHTHLSYQFLLSWILLQIHLIDSPTKETYTSLIPIPSPDTPPDSLDWFTYKGNIHISHTNSFWDTPPDSLDWFTYKGNIHISHTNSFYQFLLILLQIHLIDSPTKETYTSLIPIPSRYSSRFTWLIHLQRKHTHLSYQFLLILLQIHLIDSPTKETYTSLIPIPSRYSSRFTWLIHLQRKHTHLSYQFLLDTPPDSLDWFTYKGNIHISHTNTNTYTSLIPRFTWLIHLQRKHTHLSYQFLLDTPPDSLDWFTYKGNIHISHTNSF